MHPASTSQVHSRPDHGSHLSTQRSAYFLRSEKQLRSRKNEHSEWTGGTPLADPSRLSNRAHFPHVPCKGSGSPANTSQALSAAQQPLDYPSRKLVTSCTHPADTANACASTHPLVFPRESVHCIAYRGEPLHSTNAQLASLQVVPVCPVGLVVHGITVRDICRHNAFTQRQ